MNKKIKKRKELRTTKGTDLRRPLPPGKAQRREDAGREVRLRKENKLKKI